jgi:hypothetical protein
MVLRLEQLLRGSFVLERYVIESLDRNPCADGGTQQKVEGIPYLIQVAQRWFER